MSGRLSGLAGGDPLRGEDPVVFLLLCFAFHRSVAAVVPAPVDPVVSVRVPRWRVATPGIAANRVLRGRRHVSSGVG
ncbi:hypothetical protein C8J57DRAFT_1321935 [Mycena rebaudengoi]|nr:hypothetical protein C8J57DRAFT_1321935 [Mycena rebaudengoi]